MDDKTRAEVLRLLDEAREAYHEAWDAAASMRDGGAALVNADRLLFAARAKIGSSPELPPNEPRHIDVTSEDA